MSTLKVNEIDSKTGTTVSVAAGKTLDVPATSTLTVAGTQTITGTVNLASSTLTLPATLPATIGTNITQLPGANITGTIPAAALGNVDTSGIQANKDDIALLAFQTQSNGSLARYNLVDQSVDSFEDATGVNATTSLNETRVTSGTQPYYVGGEETISSGGTQTTHGLYTVHSFLSTGNTNYTINGTVNHDMLIVAAGGGGGGHDGGGGGAGGFRTFSTISITASGAVVTVGAGGAGTTGQSGSANPGGASAVAVTGASTYTSAGGGGGGNESGNGASGGSGGGGGNSGSSTTGGAGNTPSVSPAQGFAGGLANSPAAGQYVGGGGGGASAVGEDGLGGGGSQGVGGAGSANDLRTGSNVTYGGGGGGSARQSTPGANGPLGGTGGGGRGSSGSAQTGGAGTDNLGGGGGGGGDSGGVGGVGGTGIVVLRRLTAGLVEGDDLTLISNAQTAQTAPTKGDLVFTYTNGLGTTTVGTDLRAWISMDGGTTYTGDVTTGLTLTSKGTTGGHTILTANDVTLTSTSGTNMVWKIRTLNQNTASKVTRIQAVSLGWS